MSVTGRLLILFALCSVCYGNVSGFGYEVLSARLNSMEAIESDLLTFTNDTVRQLSKMVDLLMKLQIDPEHPFQEPMTVLCDQQYEGGGWTVIQRRIDGSVDFFRDWQEYKRGFGTLHGEFWLGLEHIYRLTNVAPHELVVMLEDFDGAKAQARYNRFRIGAESLNYALLELGTCVSCSAGDAMRIHLNESFSTYDRDKSKATFNCGAVFKGAWWFYKCHRSHLNGVYLKGKLTEAQDSQGIMWMDFRGDKYSLKSSKMMIRPLRTNK